MNLKEFGKQIQEYRKKQKISQTKLCEGLNISRATLSSLENGRGEIGFKKILQIIDYLGYEFTLKEKSLFPTLEDLRDE